MTTVPLARVTVRADVREPDAWFWNLPAVAQLRADGLALAPVTVLVGENGSGKSTLVEAVAHAWQESLTAQVQHWGRKPYDGGRVALAGAGAGRTVAAAAGRHLAARGSRCTSGSPASTPTPGSCAPSTGCR